MITKVFVVPPGELMQNNVCVVRCSILGSFYNYFIYFGLDLTIDQRSVRINSNTVSDNYSSNTFKTTTQAFTRGHKSA